MSGSVRCGKATVSWGPRNYGTAKIIANAPVDSVDDLVQAVEMARAEIATDTEAPPVLEALSRSCDICGAAKGKHCTNTITPGPLLGRVVHYARLVDRRRERKDADE